MRAALAEANYREYLLKTRDKGGTEDCADMSLLAMEAITNQIRLSREHQVSGAKVAAVSNEQEQSHGEKVMKGKGAKRKGGPATKKK